MGVSRHETLSIVKAQVEDPLTCAFLPSVRTSCVIRSLDDVLLPSFEVDFLVESRPLARRLHDAGIEVTAGDPRRVDTYLKADISPSTCFIVEDNGSRSVARMLSGDPRRRAAR